MGERSNFVLLPMAIAGMAQLIEGKVERVAATLAELTAMITRRAARLGLSSTAHRAEHFTAFRLPDGISPDPAELLARDHVYVSLDDGVLRVAPHLYNQSADIDRLVDVLERAL
jgi:selenocysteine lyase/cysteine desulfurase